MTVPSETTVRRFEWDAVLPSVAVVETLSEATGRDPLDLPTLEETIDTDALNDLYAAGRETEPVTVSFVYAGHEVTVIGDGAVIVEPVRDE